MTETDLERAVERYLSAKAKGSDSGSYRRSAASELERWRDWLADRDHDFATLADSSRGPQVMRRYAQHLARRARADDGIAATTARSYYAYVRAFLTWCVRDGLLDANPAKRERAEEPLPEVLETDRQQFWGPDERSALLDHVDQRLRNAKAATDEPAVDAPGPGRAARDRAIVAVLAYSGVRAAEVFRTTDDDRAGRQGVTWADVDLAEGTLRVLGKAQRYEHARLPRQARGRLADYRERLDPPTPEWPVFPTAHAPSRHRAARAGLAERGHAAEAIEAILADADVDDVLRDHEIPPPAITTTGVRNVLAALCEAADVTADGSYLTPHGARRGIGDLLFRVDRGEAQDHLRHKSPRTTREAYSHVDAGEGAARVSEILADAEETPERHDGSGGGTTAAEREPAGEGTTAGGAGEGTTDSAGES